MRGSIYFSSFVSFFFDLTLATVSSVACSRQKGGYIHLGNVQTGRGSIWIWNKGKAMSSARITTI
jgi:hypothetical protein